VRIGFDRQYRLLSLSIRSHGGGWIRSVDPTALAASCLDILPLANFRSASFASWVIFGGNFPSRSTVAAVSSISRHCMNNSAPRNAYGRSVATAVGALGERLDPVNAAVGAVKRLALAGRRLQKTPRALEA